MTRRVLFAVFIASACSKGGPAQQTATPVALPEAVAAPAPAEGLPAPSAESDEITVTSRSPEAVEQFKQGRDLFDNQRIAESIVLLKKALVLDPDFALAMAYLGQVTSGEEGQRMVDRAAELAKALPEPERTFIEAQQAYVHADIAKGTALLRKVVQAKPNDWRAQLQLGQAAFGDENWDEAVSASQRALAASPKAGSANNYIAYGLTWQGRYDEAIAAAQKQIDQLPEEPNPYDSLGEILLAAGRLDDAQAAYEKAAAKSEKFTSAMTGAAQVRFLKGDWKGGYERVKKAHDNAPRTLDALGAAYFEAWALAAQGKTAAMLKVYDAMEKKAQDEKLAGPAAGVDANRGFMLALVGRPADALKHIDAADARAKDASLLPATARNQAIIRLQARILTAWKMKKAAEAESAFVAFEAEEKKGQIQRADQSAIDHMHGLVAWAKGDAKAAVESMSKCSQLDYPCRFMLVSAQRAAGDKKGAAETLAKLKASPRRDGVYLYFWATTR